MRTTPQPLSLQQIIEGVMAREGHRSNNADDLGGDTTYGITEAVARKYGYQGSMDDLTSKLAFEIYMERYVFAPRFDLIHDVSAMVGEEVIDTGINMGKPVAAKFLQRWLNAYNNKQAYYADLVVDGQVGPATITALKAFLAKRGKEGELVLWKSLNCSQGARYLHISEKREQNETFTYGWMLHRV
ncbi:glycoside hydrolase family 108 protein [Vibrio sp. ER1A]|uniref:glycoside hydrolase family 108 protein n=1 Tax=Vibrio sp. ER1A TaxID=1517681 RepID=UPI0004DD35D8|nr:putative peptidoglycan-binding domain-containing protein [Vibrio sp. ER1A]KFA98796.1 hypothetical protein HW45_07190 [Vibrio sp. ER1A]